MVLMAKPPSSFPPEGDPKQKKPRRVAIKDASFFLFKRISEDGDLSPIGSYQTEPEIRGAYKNALDRGVSQEDIRGFKGRVLEFKVED